MKSRGKSMCKHGHLHANPEAAQACELAWRIHERRKLNPLIEALRKVVLEKKPKETL